MNKKPKLLWSGDIIAKTGFARVTENVLERICEEYEVIVLGNNWWGDPHPLCDKYLIYPSSTRHQTAPFGEQRIREIVEKEKPDLIFIMNDLWILNELYRQIQDIHKTRAFKFVGYYPMDSYGWTGCILDTMNDWDASICYTEFGAKEVVAAGYQKPIAVIPHGVTKGQFYPMDKSDARKRLGLSDDIFVVFNGNRNQFRKRIDITVEAFAKFAKDKPDTQLYLHMGLKDQGWDLMPMFARAMGREGLDPNGRIILTAQSEGPPNVEVDFLNAIYNAADVGVNTCKGEGHGLVNHEHAGCRVAQVVPDHTSTKEIFEGAGRLIRCDHVDVDTNYAREMPCPSADHLAEILTDLYENREKLDETARLCYERATSPCYDWDNIAPQFAGLFQEVLEGSYGEAHSTPVEVKENKKEKKKEKRKKRLVGAVA
jgi:glycosyltransferase involved in cell wall biosynthesis